MKRDIDGGIGRKTNTVNVYDYAVNVTLDIIGDGLSFVSSVIRIGLTHTHDFW
jgi:hypothetical protein